MAPDLPILGWKVARFKKSAREVIPAADAGFLFPTRGLNRALSCKSIGSNRYDGSAKDEIPPLEMELLPEEADEESSSADSDDTV